MPENSGPVRDQKLQNAIEGMARAMGISPQELINRILKAYAQPGANDLEKGVPVDKAGMN